MLAGVLSLQLGIRRKGLIVPTIRLLCGETFEGRRDIVNLKRNRNRWKLRPQTLGDSDSSLTLEVYTHVAGEDNERFAEQSDLILCPNSAPKQDITA